jgi:hypothetical protein
MAAGFTIASHSLVVLAIVVAYLTTTFSSAIRSEEAHLTEKFGSAYPEYRDGRLPGVTRRFSLRRAIANREHRAVTGLVLALALLAWKAL